MEKILRVLHGKFVVSKRKTVSAEKIKNKISGVILILLAVISVEIQTGAEPDGTAAVMLAMMGTIALLTNN